MTERDTALTDTVPAGVPARAAKVHVLGLAPLKERLGDRWSRLSELVHKLVETSIQQVQGPADGFIALDELSYALIFRGMTLQETQLICDAIAKSVCQALFGNQIDEVTVRSVAAAIVSPSGQLTAAIGRAIEAQLERHGCESIVVQSVHADVPGPVMATRRQLKPTPLPLDTLDALDQTLARLGLNAGFIPIWDISRKVSSALFLAPLIGSDEAVVSCGLALLAGLNPKAMAEVEISLLLAAEAYAYRLNEERKICAVGTSVSYDTLSTFQTRIQFITALQKTNPPAANPLLLQIEEIPTGTPPVRLGELAAMLARPNVRLTLEFESLRAIPHFDFKLNASVLRAKMPANVDATLADKLAIGLAREATANKAQAFLDRLDTPALLDMACQQRIRFGTGKALSTTYFAGTAPVVDFPLRLQTERVHSLG